MFFGSLLPPIFWFYSENHISVDDVNKVNNVVSEMGILGFIQNPKLLDDEWTEWGGYSNKIG